MGRAVTGQWLIRMIQAVWATMADPRQRSCWWRRVRRGCTIALILFLLLSCLSCILLGVLVGRASATGTGASLDVILVVDNSNSMFDKGGIGSDPDLRRIEAAQMFVNYLGVDSGQESHRAGVIFFGGKAQLVVPLTPLADQDRRAEIAALIAEPRRMDWTDPASALALARDTLLATSAEGGRVVVLLTDGKPEWDGDPTDAERQAVIEDLERLGEDYAGDGIRLFVAQLSNRTTDADPEIERIYVPLWRDLVDVTRGRFYSVRKADDLIDVYHDILVVLSEVETEGAIVETVLEEGTQVEMVEVEPNLARVTFVVRVSETGASTQLPSTALGTGSEGVEVGIHRPDGQVLRPTDADVRHAAYGRTAIWAVTHPRPGDWMVVMAGQGKVTIWKDYLPAPSTPTPVPPPAATLAPTSTPAPAPVPQLIVHGWPEVVLAGQPIPLSVSFQSKPQGTPTVWAEWTLGDAPPKRERLLDDGREGDTRAGDGEYSTSLNPEGVGTMLVGVWGEVGGREIAAWEGRLRVDACPTLELVVPQAEDRWEAGMPAEVQARWVVGQEALKTSGPMTVTLSSADALLHTVMTGTVGAPLLVEAPQATGPYSLTVTAIGTASPDLIYQGEIATTVAVRRSVPGWVWWGVMSLVLTGVGGWRFHRWFQHLPRVAGRLRVLEAPAGYAGPTLTDLSLLDRRLVRLGGVRAELPLPAEGSAWAVIRALSDGSGMELAPCDGREVCVNEVSLFGSHLLSDGDCIAAEGVRLRYEYLHYGL